MYTLRDPIVDAPTANLGFRWPEHTETPYPSPAHYTVTDVCLKKAPAYTIGEKTSGKATCFPDIVKRDKNGGVDDRSPGPAHYTITKRFADNDKPAHSIGKMGRSARKFSESVPGPNHYRIAVKHRPDAPKAPAHSMARRFDEPRYKIVGPGPAAYHPTPPKNYDLSCSMTKRPTDRKQFVTPAPNAFRLETGQSAKGINNGPKATLKSRASPFVYSGLAKTRLLEG
ncbi:uncharacterized protein LOC135491365 [Lineus longissimus]|uniref:uncharacterized protein LOC135491365 n=1 Tax=Lineus longissimus TaxID=88925 RepID=UPI00315C985C